MAIVFSAFYFANMNAWKQEHHSLGTFLLCFLHDLLTFSQEHVNVSTCLCCCKLSVQVPGVVIQPRPRFAHNGHAEEGLGWTVAGAITAVGGIRGRIETCPVAHLSFLPAL